MGGRIRHTQMIAALVAIAALGLIAASCSPQPGADGFYTPPAAPPTTAPDDSTPGDGAPGDGGTTPTPDPTEATHGDLIRYRASTFTIDPVNKKPYSKADSYQVMYRSTSAIGDSNAVSGTVLVPKKPWKGEGSRPLVTVGVGTRGLADSCAPSWTMTQGWDYEGYEYQRMLERGWAVAVTDMVGLGTPGVHTYEVGREQGTAVLDIVRAAHQIPEAELDPRGPIGIMGYSQGGTSAGWAAELEATYTPELNIKGTAAAGVPADLLEVAKALDGGPFVGLALLAAVGYEAAYPELDLGEFMNERGQRVTEQAKDLCITQFDGISQMLKLGNSWFGGFLKDRSKNPLEDPRWVERVNENRLGSTVPAAPVLMQHARFDQMVAYPQAKNLRREWCEAGANVTWRTHLLAEHVLGMVFSIDENLSFLAARFADKPVKGNC